MKYFLPLLIVCMIFFGCDISEKNDRDFSPEKISEISIIKDSKIDLEQILKRKRLIVLIENTSTSYYMYRGIPMGYDYELIKKFADDLGVHLEVKIIKDLNEMFEALNNGEGDIIACNLNITPERQQIVDFSIPFANTKQVLVQRRPNTNDSSYQSVSSLRMLQEQEIYLHKYSTFYENLKKIESDSSYHFNVIEASGNLDSEGLVRLVAEGQIPYTITDENLALLNATYYTNLDVSKTISEEQDIGWAIRKTSPELKKTLNEWLSRKDIRHHEKIVYQKYFTAKKQQKRRVSGKYSSLGDKMISPYDKTIKELTKKSPWDWRLVAAVIRQESNFDPTARSWAGAFGLMQLMPETALELGIDTTQTERENIRAGVKYLNALEKFWENRIPDQTERMKFVLASYNVGPGHVLDAQKIATHLGNDPLIWEGNVDEALLLKSQIKYSNLEGVKHGYCRGGEPYNYVRNVMSTFQQYKSIEG